MILDFGTVSQISLRPWSSVMVRTAIYFVSASVSALVLFGPLGSLNAAGTAEQQQACFEDAIRFCGSEIPDVERITACMVRNIDKLSPRCRVQFGQPVVGPKAASAKSCKSCTMSTTSPVALSGL
jgi:hypothetical protein